MSKERRITSYLAGEITTTSGEMPKDFEGPAPDSDLGSTGQHKDYWVLSENERAKGFVRPVRNSYKHVGIAGPTYPLQDLSPEQLANFASKGWVKYEPFPEGSHGLGRYWSQKDLDRAGHGCRTVTTMGWALAETYAREPGFYGATFCVGCGGHFPVGRDGEFVWIENDGTVSKDRVGT